MSQNQTRTWQQWTTWVANTAAPVNNVPTRGIPADQRLDSLIFDFDLTIAPVAPAAPTTAVMTPPQAFTFLESLFQRVRMYSTALGQVIGQMNLSQLVRTWLGLGVRVHGLEQIIGGVTLGASTILRFQVEIPFNAPFMSIKGLHAPQAYQFPDGGIEVTTGAGTFDLEDVAAAAVPWEITAGRYRILWSGRRMGMKIKTSPFMTELANASDLGRVLPQGGLHFGLAQLTDNVFALTNPVTALAYGIELRADGRPVYTGEEFDPTVGLCDVIGNSVNSFLAQLASLPYNGALNGTPGAAGVSLVQTIPYIPILYPTDYTTVPDQIVRGSKVQITYQNGYTTPYQEGHIYVRPVDNVGDVSGCECVGPAPIGPGNSLAAVAKSAEPFMPALIG